MIRRVYIANRGEIARRVIHTAHSLGLETVIGVSEADTDSLAAREAGRRVVLGPAPPQKSYLDAERNVHAARETGCDAIHPGYGFLSERAVFAGLCERNGLVFVGPDARTIEAVGDKLQARKLAQAAGVPCTEGSGKLENADQAVAIGRQVGFPVVTKASAGGGGRGMVVARDETELREGFERASRTAREAFGDGTLFLERYVETARHIEVQVLGDGRGGVVHFGERDCSLQRRYQKMIEEAPAAILPDDVRQRMHEAATALLSSIQYRNAGTVEFLYDVEREAFSFMEVNARIQVEHPVSEEVTGTDLIREQLLLALDPSRRIEQPQSLRGHAIEARVLAEDPAQGFAPSPGVISGWDPPVGDGIRLDTATQTGSAVPPFYDSMIAKLVVTGRDRAEAVNKLAGALGKFRIEGIGTNIPFLMAIAAHPDFKENRVSTRWLEQVLIPRFSADRAQLMEATDAPH